MRIDERLTGDIMAVHMDEGIRPLIAVLNRKGLPTTGSCEGHDDRVGMYGHDGWVQFDPRGWKAYTEPSLARVKAFLIAAGRVEDCRWAIDLRYSAAGPDQSQGIEASPRLVIWTSVTRLERDAKERAKWKARILREIEMAAETFL